MVGMWTMDELVERVSAALAAEYSGAPNGRVRDLPDRRAIRWYTTTGLVDRPLGLRGRTALYGPRHLLQLVAVKRRQAEGHTLAAIQAELHGVSDSVLADVARVPEEFLADNGARPDQEEELPRARFWAAPAGAGAGAAKPHEEQHVPATPLVELPRHVPPAPPRTPPAEVGALRLRGGAILVLPVGPRPEDRAAIAAAAEPLLDLLADRGLLKFDDGSPS
jgi:DNA-binding transcriptional MerR regulator